MTVSTELGPVGQILIPVADVDRAADFYEHVLGLPVWMKFPGIAFFDAHGVRLYLATVPQEDFQGRATVYFWVDDVSATYGRLLERGAVARQPPHVPFAADEYDLWMAFVQDLDGNNIGIMREAPKGTSAG